MTGGRDPYQDAVPHLDELPFRPLFQPMVTATQDRQITRTRHAALVMRLRMIRIALNRLPPAPGKPARPVARFQ